MTPQNVVDWIWRWRLSAKLEVRYLYSVGGVEYTGDTLFSGGMQPDWQDYANYGGVEEINARLVEDASVAVRYNPAHPERAYLLESSNFGSWCLIGIGVFLLIAQALHFT